MWFLSIILNVNYMQMIDNSSSNLKFNKNFSYIVIIFNHYLYFIILDCFNYRY